MKIQPGKTVEKILPALGLTVGDRSQFLAGSSPTESVHRLQETKQ